MAANVIFHDNSPKVKSQMADNVVRALTAMGIKAVNLILKQMQKGYGKPIWKTGDLQRDVSYDVGRSSDNSVDVGNTLEYGPYVHEGTYKMAGRPYIKDALTGEGHKQQLQKVAEAYLKQGF